VRLSPFTFAVGTLIAMALGTSPARAGEPASAPRSAKQDLTPQSLTELHTLVRPHDHEWRHLRVRWLTDVVAARKQAAAEDKPIIICYTGGAGYNEPLGTC
jgi:hypothetical protein